LGVGYIFLYIEAQAISMMVFYALFICVALIALGSADFSKATFWWEGPAVASLIFAIVTFLLEKNLTTFALASVVASVLILASSTLPLPASKIAKAVGAIVVSIAVLEITSHIAETYGGPLLLPNLLLYGAIMALAAGYVAELRFPQLYYHLSLGVIAVMGVIAIVTGGTLLQELPPLTASHSFADVVYIISAYSSATLLMALGVLAIIYLVRVFLTKKAPPSERQPKPPEEIELQPYTSDNTSAR